MSHPANRIRAIESCRNWNALFPPGTEVTFDGRQARTWSPAGLGARDEPVIFLDGIEEPVPLGRCEVPGWVKVYGRKR